MALLPGLNFWLCFLALGTFTTRDKQQSHLLQAIYLLTVFKNAVGFFFNFFFVVVKDLPLFFSIMFICVGGGV